MAIAAGAEDPRAVAFVSIRLGVEDAGAHHVGWVQLRILGMHVEDGVAQHADRNYRVDTLPEEMARIEVASYVLSRDCAQPEHRLRTVDNEARMHLDCNLHPVVSSKLRVLDPVGCDHLVPLPVKDRAEVRR